MFGPEWNQWRTSTVVGLCQRIRETADLGALPILADALEDVCCDDVGVLNALRAPDMQLEEAQTEAFRLLARIEGGEPDAAVTWVDNLCDGVLNMYHDDDVDGPGFRVTYERLMAAAHQHLQNITTDDDWDTMHLPFQTPDEWFDKLPEFWKRFETITGIEAGDKRNNFVRCGC